MKTASGKQLKTAAGKQNRQILFFDTSNFDRLEFILIPESESAGKILKKSVPTDHFKSELTLPALWRFLKENKVAAPGKSSMAAKIISRIYFVSGPGSFSGIRVGAAIALALQLAWNVPIFALKKNQIPKKISAASLRQARGRKVYSDPDLEYGGPPKITKEKKKKLRNT